MTDLFFPFADLKSAVAVMTRGGGSPALSPLVLHCFSSSKLFVQLCVFDFLELRLGVSPWFQTVLLLSGDNGGSSSARSQGVLVVVWSRSLCGSARASLEGLSLSYRLWI